jgi:hypothetical protein
LGEAEFRSFADRYGARRVQDFEEVRFTGAVGTNDEGNAGRKRVIERRKRSKI